MSYILFVLTGFNKTIIELQRNAMLIIHNNQGFPRGGSRWGVASLGKKLD